MGQRFDRLTSLGVVAVLLRRLWTFSSICQNELHVISDAVFNIEIYKKQGSPLLTLTTSDLDSQASVPFQVAADGQGLTARYCPQPTPKLGRCCGLSLYRLAYLLSPQ